ncbi:Protein phosphatase PP2A regulatory subunit B [Mortierella sp. AM989]|nr:Protein phosphatase PP2A regulatory subunit B [Mortierella sp. AM989]
MTPQRSLNRSLKGLCNKILRLLLIYAAVIQLQPSAAAEVRLSSSRRLPRQYVDTEIPPNISPSTDSPVYESGSIKAVDYCALAAIASRTSQGVIPYKLAKECYESFAFDPQIRDSVIQNVKSNLESFYVFFDIARSPPHLENSDLSPVDLSISLGELGQMTFPNDHAFHQRLSNLISQLQDPHTTYKSMCYQQFLFIQPISTYGVYEDGRQQVKVATVLSQFDLRLNNALIDCEVTHIDGRPAFDVISEYAKTKSYSKDRGVRINKSFSYLAHDKTGSYYDRYVLGAFAQRTSIPPNATVEYKIDCKSRSDSDKRAGSNASLQTTLELAWSALDATMAPYSDTKSYRKQFCSVDSIQTVKKFVLDSASPDDFKSVPTATFGSRRKAKELYRGAYASFHLLSDGVTGVLRLGTESPNKLEEVYPSFYTNIDNGFSALESAGTTKLVIDLQSNSGGIICWGRYVLQMLFPGTIDSPYIYSLRASPLAQVLAKATFTYEQEGASPYEGLVDPATGDEFSTDSWMIPGTKIPGRESLFSREVTDRYCLAVEDVQSDADDAMFEPKDIVILTNGFCGSTCAVLALQLHERYGVRTVAVGGEHGQSMAFSSFPGGAVQANNTLWVQRVQQKQADEIARTETVACEWTAGIYVPSGDECRTAGASFGVHADSQRFSNGLQRGTVSDAVYSVGGCTGSSMEKMRSSDSVTEEEEEKGEEGNVESEFESEEGYEYVGKEQKARMVVMEETARDEIIEAIKNGRQEVDREDIEWLERYDMNRLRTLIVDNYDSYTFNLLQLFDQHQLENVVVIRNDQFSWSQFEHQILPHFDQIILSPGPGRPEREQDFGICTQILQTRHIPVFGVCLGHQGIGFIHGAKVTYGPEPVHGQIARIKHDNTGIFQGVPQEFEAVRYHSLVIQDHDLPIDLVPTAWCYSFPLIVSDNLTKQNATPTMSSIDRTLGCKSIMGVRHRTLPHHGVQFHPESICTQYGKTMMSNFFNISRQFYEHQSQVRNTQQHLPDHIRALSVIPTRPVPTSPTATVHKLLKMQPNPYSLIIQALDPSIFPEPESVFSSLFLTGPRSKAASWWLDSARQPHPMSRFSFMGGVETRSCLNQSSKSQRIGGAAQAVIQYSTLHKEIYIRRYSSHSGDSDIKRVKLGCKRTKATESTFWDWISNAMAEFGKDSVETVLFGPQGEQRDLEEVPFDFFSGMIGYFGYEMKRESLDGYQTPIEQQCQCFGHAEEGHPCTCDCLRQPDASFILATQAVVFDHVERRVYVLGVVDNFMGRQHRDIGAPVGFQSRKTCQDWIKSVTRSIIHLATSGPKTGTTRRNSAITTTSPRTSKGGEPYLVKQSRRRRSSVGMLSPCKVDVAEKDYIKAIQDSLNYIREGESYELCLTTQFRARLPLYLQKPECQGDGGELYEGGDPAYDLYKILRKLNPAPFSAFLSIPTALDHQSAETRDQDKSNLFSNPTDAIIGKLVILSSSPERFLKIGQKPSDEEEGSTDPKIGGSPPSSSRTVEMKPIKGTVAVARGCFCEVDEGCRVNEPDDDNNSEHADEDDGGNGIQVGKIEHGGCRSLVSDRCTEARRREDQCRIDSLSKNIKERAENLMIVDLIRNDLAHVCSSKSVRVPYLMKVESYETVHQLVTTVRGELFDHVDSTQAVKACFPPGSMTGAPKLRSVQLLDSLENHVKRGVYSGCLGYIGIPAVAAAAKPEPKMNTDGYASGNKSKRVRSAVDFAVVIRTAVLSVGPTEDRDSLTTLVGDLSVGAGGALTILSDANEEWREVLLKSRSVVPSVLTYLHQNA